VIASETANNATIGGGLIIALTLGIPGDPTSAVLLGGLMIHGLQPGPQLFVNNPEVLYGVYFSLFFSSFIMMLTLFLFVRHLAKVVNIPRYCLQPFVLVLCWCLLTEQSDLRCWRHDVLWSCRVPVGALQVSTASASLRHGAWRITGIQLPQNAGL